MNPSTAPESTTRRPIGLTDKGRAYAALVQVRDNWDTFDEAQRAEVAALVAKLYQALRRESGEIPHSSARVPLVGRLSA